MIHSPTRFALSRTANDPACPTACSLSTVDTGIALAASIGADVYAFGVVAPCPELSCVVDVDRTGQEFFL